MPEEGENVRHFRADVRRWFGDHYVGPVTSIGATTGHTAEDWPIRVAWERALGDGGWIGLAWPRAVGGRECTLAEELVFAEEYALAGAPVRPGFFGENLLGPTLIQFGTESQRRRFLPPIIEGREYWCQGFSEPGAGSDLASVATRAELVGSSWVLNGQKIWTSQGQFADWIFVLARTESGSVRHRGLSFLMVRLDQPGIEVRPIAEMTGGQHFCEVFFDHARTDGDLIVGAPGEGWSVAMATLGFERGTAFIGQQVRFRQELADTIARAQSNGAIGRSAIRQKLAQAAAELQLMGWSARRSLASTDRATRPGPEASIAKLFWSQWHQRLGELQAEVLGADATVLGLSRVADEMVHNLLFSRSDTIYAGSSEVQRNVIAERVLGLPRG